MPYDRHPTAWYKGDYEALTQDFPSSFKGRRRVEVGVNRCLKWDDVLLTTIMLFGGLQDLTWGVFRLGYPEWTLETISQFNKTDITAPMVRLTRVGGWGNLEAGILAMLLVTWRIVLWYTRHPFRGQNFQFGFALTTVGKTGAFITNASLTGWQPFAADAPRDNIVLFVRALIALLALILSLYTYQSSWAFLRRDGGHESGNPQ
jgi:hypothetical protein